MTRSGQQGKKVLILTGFSPVRLPELQEMGIPLESLPLLLSMIGKDTFRFSIPAVGPVAIASYLRQHGIEVRVADVYYDDVGSSDSDIVGISSTFLTLNDAKTVADLIREQNSSATIVLGGPLSWSIAPKKLLETMPNVDYIVQREGETTFLELIDVIHHGGDPYLVNGIAFRRQGDITITPPRPPLDFETLPLPAWELAGIPSPKRLPVLPIETSRGCPYHCAYCSEVTYWGKPVRYRSSKRVVDELRSNARRFGITTFRITDSCFSAPPGRSAQICDAIYEQLIKEGIPIKWSAYARLRNLSPDLLVKMKRSGCVALDIGLESGSPKVLQLMGKDYSPEMAVTIAKAAGETGILTNYNLVIGFPGETAETVQATTELIERAAPDTFACFVFFLAPNTTVYLRRKEYGTKGEGLSWRHATRNSEEAKEAMLKLTRDITSSVSFPAGEHFACYLTSLGYSEREIRDFYRATAKLVKEPDNKAARAKVKAVSARLAPFC